MRPATVNQGHLRRTIDRLGLDSVNVLARAHYRSAFSRLGRYDRTLLDNAAWGSRRDRHLFEYWARALLVHNDNAGTDPEPREAIEAALYDVGIGTIYCAHGDEDLGAALRTPVDFIIAAGGDGTVADVVSAIEDPDRPIAILPLGGSKNLAHALGVDGPWRELPRRWSLDGWTRLDRCGADGPRRRDADLGKWFSRIDKLSLGAESVTKIRR